MVVPGIRVLPRISCNQNLVAATFFLFASFEYFWAFLLSIGATDHDVVGLEDADCIRSKSVELSFNLNIRSNAFCRSSNLISLSISFCSFSAKLSSCSSFQLINSIKTYMKRKYVRLILLQFVFIIFRLFSTNLLIPVHKLPQSEKQ